jgi:hypothetical protein
MRWRGIVKSVGAVAAVDAFVDGRARSQQSASIGSRGSRITPVELKSIPLFAQLSPSNLDELADLSFQSRLEARSLFIEQDEECDTLYAILEGTAELFSAIYERETVIDVAQLGAVLAP